MNEILSLQQKIQETSREYDYEVDNVRECDELITQLERKKNMYENEIESLQQQIEVSNT